MLFVICKLTYSIICLKQIIPTNLSLIWTYIYQIILDNINGSVLPGQILAIIGASGKYFTFFETQTCC